MGLCRNTKWPWSLPDEALGLIHLDDPGGPWFRLTHYGPSLAWGFPSHKVNILNSECTVKTEQCLCVPRGGVFPPLSAPFSFPPGSGWMHLLHSLLGREALWEPQLHVGFSVPALCAMWDESLISGVFLGVGTQPLGHHDQLTLPVLLQHHLTSFQPWFQFCLHFCTPTPRPRISLAFLCSQLCA